MRAALLVLLVGACANGAGNDGPVDAAHPPDAPRSGPDAMRPDANVTPTPDARVVPDAMPADACVASLHEELGNGNFDAAPLGVDWTQLPQSQAYPPIVTSANMPVAPDTPDNAVWLGGLTLSTDALYQAVSIPAGATTLTITGMKWFVSQETAAGQDVLHVEIRSAADQVLENVVTWDDLDTDATWTPFSLTPTGNYGGQTIRLYIWSHTNDSLNTNFFLDSLSFTLEACP